MLVAVLCFSFLLLSRLKGAACFAAKIALCYLSGYVGAAALTSRPEDRLALKILQAFNVCFTRIYHRLEIRSPLKLPRRGNAIIVCNHTSGLDPLLIQSASRRLIVWMMAREYYEVKWLLPFFHAIEAIPVDRDRPDAAATRAALKTLASGHVLGVFPEGRIETSRELLPFQPGIAVLAARSRAGLSRVPGWNAAGQGNGSGIRIPQPRRASLREADTSNA